MFIIKKGKFEQKKSSRTSRQEEMELEEAFHQVTRAANGEAEDPYRPNPGCAASTSEPGSAPVDKRLTRNKKIALISFCVVAAVLLVSIGIGIWFYLSSTADNGLILDNVYAAGINLGGMTPASAKDALQEAVDQVYSKQSIVITLPDATLKLAPADTKVSLNIDLLVEEAYNYGRGGSRSDRMAAMAAAPLTSHTIDLYDFLTLDTTYIQNAIAQFSREHTATLTQPSVTVEGEKPSLPIPEGADVYIDPADPNAVDYTKEVHQTLTITLGTQSLSFDEEDLFHQVLAAYNECSFDPIAVEYTQEDPQPLDLEALIGQYCSAPVDAVINEEDYSVKQEIWGYGFDQNDAKQKLAAAKGGQTITLELRYIKPTLVKAELDATFFRDVLATADTEYYYNPPRTNNLQLACQAINGTLLKPGDTFSFNGTVGERTAEKGYQAAAAYVGGKTVDQIGGGICQVASTLYYCTLYSDLEVVDRTEHMYTVDYVPLGMDATVNWGTIDYAFRNNTNYPIRIEAWAEDGYVHISFLGTDEKNYYVEMDYSIQKVLDWKTVEKEMDEDNQDGYEDGEVIQSPYTGYIVDTYKYKYDKETEELISSAYEAYSEYDSRDRLVCKINKPTETTTAPTETTPPSTEAPVTEDPSETTDPPADDGSLDNAG